MYIIRGKIAQTSISKPFRIFPCLFTHLGLYVGRSINGVVFFFAALAEVQVTFLSVLNLPRQELPLVQLVTVVFAARCYLPQKYFAIRQRTINRG